MFQWNSVQIYCPNPTAREAIQSEMLFSEIFIYLPQIKGISVNGKITLQQTVSPDNTLKRKINVVNDLKWMPCDLNGICN